MEIDNTKKCYLVLCTYYFGAEEVPYSVFESREKAEGFISSAPPRNYCANMSTLYWTYYESLSSVFMSKGRDISRCQKARDDFDGEISSLATALFKQWPDKTFVLDDRDTRYRIVEVDYFV